MARKKRNTAKNSQDTELKQEKFRDYTKAKYPALNFSRQVANRREYLDIDYLDKLNDEEKEFLNSFLSETVITNFKHKGKKLYKSKKAKKEFYQDNNRRNRCMLSKAKATGTTLIYTNDTKGQKFFNQKVEDAHKSADYVNDIEEALTTMIEMKQQGFIDDDGNLLIEVTDTKGKKST